MSPKAKGRMDATTAAVAFAIVGFGMTQCEAESERRKGLAPSYEALKMECIKQRGDWIQDGLFYRGSCKFPNRKE